MRHIHVELARKEPAVELPVQDGDLPLPSTRSESPESEVRRVVPRPFGEEEIRLQKVYQLSILSQRGGFGESQETLRPVRVGMKRGLEGTPVPVAHKRFFQQTEDDDDDESDGEVLCGSGVEPLFSNSLLEHRDSEIPRSPPLSLRIHRFLVAGQPSTTTTGPSLMPSPRCLQNLLLWWTHRALPPPGATVREVLPPLLPEPRPPQQETSRPAPAMSQGMKAITLSTSRACCAPPRAVGRLSRFQHQLKLSNGGWLLNLLLHRQRRRPPPLMDWALLRKHQWKQMAWYQDHPIPVQWRKDFSPPVIQEIPAQKMRVHLHQNAVGWRCWHRGWD